MEKNVATPSTWKVSVLCHYLTTIHLLIFTHILSIQIIISISKQYSTWEQIRSYRRGHVYDFYQGAHDLNRNLYGQGSPYSDLNYWGQNLIEVFFVLLNSGLVSMDNQPGNSAYGDSILYGQDNGPDIHKFEAWFVLYKKFLMKYHHRPQTGPLNISPDHFFFRNPQEKRLSTYYSGRSQKEKKGVLWTSYRKNRVDEMIRRSLPVRDPFQQTIAPNNICRHCLQRFICKQSWHRHQNKCYFDLTNKEAQQLINLAVCYTTFITDELIAKTGWKELNKSHWRKYEGIYRRYNSTWAEYPYQGEYNEAKCLVLFQTIRQRWKYNSLQTGIDRNINKLRHNIFMEKIEEKRQKHILSKERSISSFDSFFIKKK